MSTRALEGLRQGVAEVDYLMRADPAPWGKLSPEPEITRAVLRSAVVLLSSHLEGYLRSVTTEVVEEINNSTVDPRLLEERLRLQHSRVAITDVIERKWENRAKALEGFIRSEGWLWGGENRQPLSAESLLSWMKTPKPDRIVRLYRLWGIKDIITRITRTDHTRRDFRLHLETLVDKRNNIAHGDFATEATTADIRLYRGAVSNFCERADRALLQHLSTVLGVAAW